MQELPVECDELKFWAELGKLAVKVNHGNVCSTSYAEERIQHYIVQKGFRYPRIRKG